MKGPDQGRMEQLRSQIRHHDRLYYEKDSPSISDFEYDRLFQELKKLEEAHPELITPDSPTQRVSGAPLETMLPFIHRVTLLSLDSLFTEEEIGAFVKRIEKDLGSQKFSFVCEPKFDGLSVELVYEKGYFARGGTRGDGTRGEDITLNLKTIKALPLKLMGDSKPHEISLRGEIIMPFKAFDQLNKSLVEKGEEPFANPRNAASGTMRQLDPRIAASRPLDVYAYGLLHSSDWKAKTHWEVLNQIEAWGLKTTPHKRLCHNIQDILEFHREMEAKRDSLPFEIDGIVVKLNELALQEELGERSRVPRWACALKFKPRQEETQVMDIVVQVGRQGTLTPVALLKPVDVGGVTVSRATLHNLDIIRKLDVRVGDRVKVARAGDVIPEVVEVLTQHRNPNAHPFQMPAQCPACGSNVELEGSYYFCEAALLCPAQKSSGLVHFASKRAMDIEGLGVETVDLLLREGLISNPAQLYDLTSSMLQTLPSFKEKKATNLIQAIEESKTQNFYRFLFGIGIRHVGEQTAKLLADHFKNIESIAGANVEEIQQIQGIGPEIAESVASYFSKKENQELMDLFKSKGLALRIDETLSNRPFWGKKFLFTGELSSLGRMEAKQKIEELGGQMVASPSKKTDYVIVGENPGSKLAKAQALGLTLLSEEDFIKLMENS